MTYLRIFFDRDLLGFSSESSLCPHALTHRALIDARLPNELATLANGEDYQQHVGVIREDHDPRRFWHMSDGHIANVSLAAPQPHLGVRSPARRASTHCTVSSIHALVPRLSQWRLLQELQDRLG